jgi:hypothetical protein
MAPAVRHHAEARAFAHLAPGIPLDENAFHPDVALPPPKNEQPRISLIPRIKGISDLLISAIRVIRG